MYRGALPILSLVLWGSRALHAKYAFNMNMESGPQPLLTAISPVPQRKRGLRAGRSAHSWKAYGARGTADYVACLRSE